MLVGQIREKDNPTLPNTLRTHKVVIPNYINGPYVGCGKNADDWEGKKMVWVCFEADAPTCEHPGCQRPW